MKRKLFNAALFGAVLVAAPVSTFVSCADYDTDIAAVNKQVEDLKGLVDQKETAIKAQIAALEAQDKALAEKDAELAKALADCKANCANELAQCKADCAAARAQLQAAIDDLKAALAAAEKKHGDDVAALVAQDGELQKGIDKANADLEAVDARLKIVEDGLANTQTDVQNLVEGLTGVRGDIKTIKDELARVENLINTKVAELTKTINDTKAELVGQIAGNATKITALEGVVAANKAEFDTYKAAADAEIAGLKAKDAALAADIETLFEGLSYTQADITNLSEGVMALQAQVNALDAQVYKNTIAIVDLAARILDAEAQIAEATEKLALLTADLEAFKVAQHAVDVAQDAQIAAVIASYTVDGETYNYDNINKAYKDALDYAYQAAQLAEQNAKDYADGNFYNKAKVDELLEALNAQRDADFFTWEEQVLLPVLGGLDERIVVLEDGLANTQTDVFNLTEGLRQVSLQADENSAKIAEVEEAYKAADAKIAEEFRAWIEQELNPAFAAVYETIAELGAELSAEVKGFVLEPASYYEGIQAIEGTSYEYTKWNVTDPKAPVHNGDYVKYCPAVTAHYHINPSKAVLSTDVANYSYAVLDRTNRGVNTELQPVVTNVAQNAGMLDVTLKFNAEGNKTPAEHVHGDVTVMALQYTNPAAKAENQVVTSDYAVLYLNPLKEVSLVSATDSEHAITDEFVSVVANGDQDVVAYSDSYDFTEHIMTMFGDENAVSTLPEGFTYAYTLVDGDKDYFATADGVVTPQLPGGKPATTACVGKSATWRIDVKHGNDVVEVGFYKLTIVGEAVIETADAVVATEDYIVACAPYSAPALSTTVKLENVWKKVAEVTGESLEDVKTKYSVKVNPLDHNFIAPVQFIEYTSKDDRVLYKEYEGLGSMSMDPQGTVISWNIEYDDPNLADLFTPTKERKSVKTYIQVRSNDAISKDTYNEFYLPIVWAPNAMEEWGESQSLSWSYTRVANQWQSNKLTREEAELRLYADLTTEKTPFVYNIPVKAMVDYKFDNANLTFTGTAKDFVNVQSGDIKPVEGHFVFVQHPFEDARFYDVVGEDGITDTYELTVSEDGSKLLAGRGKTTPVVIATITPEGVVTLENNSTSQLLLNAYDKDQLDYGETLCARVGLAAKCCAGKVEVVDGDFDVRFIKPLTVVAEDLDIADGDDTTEPGKITTSILNSIVAFNGKTLAENPAYISTFGVEIDLGEIKDWKTNYNAVADDFSKTLGQNKIDDLFELTVDKNTHVVKPGFITYKNNTAVLSEFIVIVPVKVKYIWNAEPVAVNIKLHVGRTISNSNRR